MAPVPASILLGPASLDRYVRQGVVLPGGGALNMAYHWASAGVPACLFTRIGDDVPEVFLDFLRRHRIDHVPTSIVAPGSSCSIDIELGADRQPWMDHFVEGVWTDFHLLGDEERLLAGAVRLHAVLVDPVVREVERLGAAGRLDHLAVSGDFLSFRHYTLDRFADTMRHLQLGFVGWPGEPEDPVVVGIRDVAFRHHALVVVTLGARGVIAFDGRADGVERWFGVDALDVRGTTVGCGDAFIAAFLAAWWPSAQDAEALAAAVEAGKAAGALATTWLRPLPDSAY